MMKAIPERLGLMRRQLETLNLDCQANTVQPEVGVRAVASNLLDLVAIVADMAETMPKPKPKRGRQAEAMTPDAAAAARARYQATTGDLTPMTDRDFLEAGLAGIPEEEVRTAYLDAIVNGFIGLVDGEEVQVWINGEPRHIIPARPAGN